MDFWVFFFSKIFRENSSFINTWQEYQALYLKTYLHLHLRYLVKFFLEWENFSGKSKENQNTFYVQ